MGIEVLSRDGFFEILKSSSRIKCHDLHIPSRVIIRAAFIDIVYNMYIVYNLYIFSILYIYILFIEGWETFQSRQICKGTEKKVFEEIHLLLICLFHHEDKWQKNVCILMRVQDARFTMPGMGMAATDAEHKEGSPRTGWRCRMGVQQTVTI